MDKLSNDTVPNHTFISLQPTTNYNRTILLVRSRPQFAHVRLKLTDRPFIHHVPELRNSLPKQLRQPSAPQSFGSRHSAIQLSYTLLALSTHHFHSKLKTFPFATTMILFGRTCYQRVVDMDSLDSKIISRIYFLSKIHKRKQQTPQTHRLLLSLDRKKSTVSLRYAVQYIKAI